MKRFGNKLINILAVIGIIVIIVEFIFILLIWIFAGITITSKDLDKYSKLKSDESPELMVFPESLENVLAVNEYHHIDMQLAGGVEIFLDVTYGEHEYYREIERLAKINYTFDDYPTKYIQIDNCQLFNQITYISVFNSIARYEYACVDDANYRIVYVSIDGMSHDDVSFPKEYLPRDYIKINANSKSYYRLNLYDSSNFVLLE